MHIATTSYKIRIYKSWMNRTFQEKTEFYLNYKFSRLSSPGHYSPESDLIVERVRFKKKSFLCPSLINYPVELYVHSSHETIFSWKDYYDLARPQLATSQMRTFPRPPLKVFAGAVTISFGFQEIVDTDLSTYSGTDLTLVTRTESDLL